ncbi:MAG TPA: nuclear transport factor 2 family protein [Microbacterium sp.]|nr:nuclear transport factor 2 family protein [Microbacterium sp.]
MPDTTRVHGGIGLLLDWIDALRSADLDRIRTLLDPRVTWHGLTDELACGGREEVIGAIEGQLPMCMGAEALELVVAPDHLILGTRNRSLPDPPGVSLGGQIYNVYELGDGRIREIRDFAARRDALRAAGVDGEDEWR